MGKYLNPLAGASFAEALSSPFYADKTLMLECLNACVDTEQRFVGIAWPRGCGKSVAADMICAYYAKDQDSGRLFDTLKIARAPSYRKFMNRFDVVRINMREEFLASGGDVDAMIAGITNNVRKELQELCPEAKFSDNTYLPYCLWDVFLSSGRTFVLVIDEWDCMLWEHPDALEDVFRYEQWLACLLKDKEYVSLAYMTGVLPLKQFGFRGNLNMFCEYSTVWPGQYSEFMGITAAEVTELCRRHDADPQLMIRNFGGYESENGTVICNCAAVLRSLGLRADASVSDADEETAVLQRIVRLKLAGLDDALTVLLDGGEVEINPRLYLNDLVSFHGSADVLTLLAHLGLLAVTIEEPRPGLGLVFRVHIPNDASLKKLKDALS